MLKTFNLLLVILFVTGSFAQGNKVGVKISPSWKIGEGKKVHVEQNTRVSFDDSLVRNTKSAYDVIVRLADISSSYTLMWTCKNDDEMAQFANYQNGDDLVQKQMIQRLKSAERKIIHAELTLQMDKTSGTISEWLNGRELLKNAEHQEKKAIKTWAATQQISDDFLLDLELNFSKKLNAAFPVWRKTLLDKANMFFESYDQKFSVNQTTTEKVMTKDILDLQDAKTEFPGTMTNDATEVNNRLILDRKIDYDKEFITLYLRKMGNTFTDLSMSDVMIFEKEQTIFDLNSSWIVNYSKKLYFEVKGMKTTSTKTITFSPL